MLPVIRGWTAVQRTPNSNLQLGAALAFVAGATNAGGFLAVGQYTSHMTGIVSAMADNLVLGRAALVLAALAALLSFVVGAMTTAILVNWGLRRHLHSSYSLPLMLEAAALLIFGLLGASLGLYTAPLVPITVPVTVLLLCFLMGLQNAVISKISHAEIRTTHVTGLVTDFGIELGKLVYVHRAGAPTPNAPAATHTGHTFAGRGCRAQSTVRCPTHTTGSDPPPISVRTRSPTRRSSTAQSPSTVSIRVPATKHARLKTTAWLLNAACAMFPVANASVPSSVSGSAAATTSISASALSSTSVAACATSTSMTSVATYPASVAANPPISGTPRFGFATAAPVPPARIGVRLSAPTTSVWCAPANVTPEAASTSPAFSTSVVAPLPRLKLKLVAVIDGVASTKL